MNISDAVAKRLHPALALRVREFPSTGSRSYTVIGQHMFAFKMAGSLSSSRARRRIGVRPSLGLAAVRADAARRRAGGSCRCAQVIGAAQIIYSRRTENCRRLGADWHGRVGDLALGAFLLGWRAR